MLDNITFADLDFAVDCSRTATVLVDYVTSPVDKTNPNNNKLALNGVLDVWQLLHVTVGSMLNTTILDVANWYNQSEQSYRGMANIDVRDSMVSSCKRDICTKLQIKGNPDLAGIGVLVAYTIEVVLATFFLVSFIASALAKKRAPSTITAQSMSASPFFAALQSSLGIFYDTALFFAFGVSIATIILAFTDVSNYNDAFGKCANFISLGVLIALWPFVAPSCAKPTLRRAIFDVTAILAMVSLVMTAVGESALTKREEYFTRWCYSMYISGFTGFGMAYMMEILIFVYVIMRLVSFTSALIRHSWAGTTRQSYWPVRVACLLVRLFLTAPMNLGITLVPKAKSWRKRVIRWCNGLAVFFAYSMVFISFYAFIETRRAIENTVTGALEQNVWGFGQILAVTGWVPTFLEFFFVSTGQLDGFQWRLPAGLTVTNDDAQDTLDAAAQPLIDQTQPQNNDRKSAGSRPDSPDPDDISAIAPVIGRATM